MSDAHEPSEQREVNRRDTITAVTSHRSTDLTGRSNGSYVTTTARVLTSVDVAAFMINRMVGVGIFTNPPLVLLFCGNQHLALWMWFVGGLFSLLWLVCLYLCSRVFFMF